MPAEVEEGEDASMEAVRRLLDELQIAVDEVGADSRRAADAVAAAPASAVALSERPGQEAPALHNPVTSLSSPTPKHSSPADEAAAPAGMAEGKEAVQPAYDGAGGAAAPGVKEPGVPSTLPSPPSPTAACAPMPALHNPAGAASTAVATSSAVHAFSPPGLTLPPAGMKLPPSTLASEEPVAADRRTQAQVQIARVEAPLTSLSSPASNQPSPAVEAAAPAEGKEAVLGAAEAGAAPPLPGDSVPPADDVAFPTPADSGARDHAGVA